MGGGGEERYMKNDNSAIWRFQIFGEHILEFSFFKRVDSAEYKQLP